MLYEVITAPWGWVIGSGIYLDDVAASFREQLLGFLGISVVIASLVSLLLLQRRDAFQPTGKAPPRGP